MSEYARLSLRGIALIPQNLKCTKKIGVSEKIADFVIPFGGVMSMNGTAIYEVVGALPGHP